MPDTHGLGLLVATSPAELEDEIWLEVSRRHSPLQDVPPPAAAPAATLNGTLSATLAELLAMDGAAFVAAAYVTVLGRPADPAGIAALTAALHRGCDRADLLRGLQRSPEGRRAGRALAGLQPHRLARRVGRIPGLGRAARVVERAWARLESLRPQPAHDAYAALQAELQARLTAFGSDIDAWRRTMQAHLAEQQLAVDATTRRVSAMRSAQEATARDGLATLAGQGQMLATVTERQAGLARQVAAVEDGAFGSLLAVADQVAGHERRLAALESVFDADAASARIDAAAGAMRAGLERQLAEARTQARQDLAEQQRRTGLLLDAVQHPATAADDQGLDELYLQFEDRFRGRREDIMQRQRVHLPRLLACDAGSAARPVLDIGAGRGEFLELLREQGLSGRGVDSNAAMAAACRQAGLVCEEGDALACLAAVPDGALGAVTGFHIVEHVPFRTVVRLLDETLRALAPGGLLLLETPNPANILTASRYFYLDPTHRNPLPGEMMAMIAQARGFVDVEIVPLHPMAQRFPGTDRTLAAALDAIFHGPQDYALVARRPLA